MKKWILFLFCLQAVAVVSFAQMKEKVRIETPGANNRGRFLRVVFKVPSTDKPIHIADIQAFGKHAET